MILGKIATFGGFHEIHLDYLVTTIGFTTFYQPGAKNMKNLTFSVQKKLVDTSEKVADRLANTLKKIKPLKF